MSAFRTALANPSTAKGRSLVPLAVATVLGLLWLAAGGGEAFAKTQYQPGVKRFEPAPRTGIGDINNASICKKGEYVVGFTGRTGAWVDRIGVRCAPILPSGVMGKPHGTAAAGGGGGAPDTSECKAGLLNAITFETTSEYRIIYDIFGECMDPRSGASFYRYITFGNRRDGSNVTRDLGDPYEQRCPTGMAATGLSLRWGKDVNAIGLICDTLVVPQPTASELPPPPPEKPIKHSGKLGGGGALIPGDNLSCQGGGGMKVTIATQTGVFIAFTPAAQPANSASPGPGECAWRDRLFAAGEAHRLALDPSKLDAQPLFDAVRTGGTFILAARPVGSFIMVHGIANVRAASAGGDIQTLGPVAFGKTNGGGGAPAGGNGDAPPTLGEMRGMSQPPQAGGACGDGNAVATVVINQPGLDKLNVRSGPGGQVLGTVPEGDTVSVIGPCGSTSGAAGFVQQANKLGGGNGWCQISAPVHGCVSAQFLDFGGGDQPGGTVGLVPRNKQPTLASAPATFGGHWNANADNVAYSLSLRQKGSGVSGSYQGNDGSVGKINGKVSGNVLRFAWVQTDGNQGSGKFVLSGDGQSFAGSYSFSNNPDAVDGAWNGTR